MFQSARIKLTAWYTLIIFVISVMFSIAIYRVITVDLERRFVSIEQRIIRGSRVVDEASIHAFFESGLVEAKHSVALRLIYINGVIIVFSSVAGYFLAGKTLLPIEETVEEQKRFIADASHELKTPLTSLKTAIEVTLRDKKLKLSEAKSVLRESLDDIDNLQNLTTNLLHLARYKQLNEHVVLHKLSLSPILTKVVTKMKPLAKDKKISIKTKISPHTIAGNEDHLEKLFTILLDNAIKYTPLKGEITIETTKSGKSVIVTVKDTGIGISQKDLPHVFDRFYRADQSRSKQGTEGFGLGLCIAKKIVDDLKGKIYVESKINTGTTFYVKLPRKL